MASKGALATGRPWFPPLALQPNQIFPLSRVVGSSFHLNLLLFCTILVSQGALTAAAWQPWFPRVTATLALSSFCLTTGRPCRTVSYTTLYPAPSVLYCFIPCVPYHRLNYNQPIEHWHALPPPSNHCTLSRKSFCQLDYCSRLQFFRVDKMRSGNFLIL